MATYVEYEWDAARIDAYEAHIVHGLLQTRDYARGALRSFWGGRSATRQIERLVEVRMRRQEALTADHGLTFRVRARRVDAVPRRRTAPTCCAGQVEHLIEIAEAEHVDLRVLPFSAGLVPASRESFSKLQFSDRDRARVDLRRAPGRRASSSPNRTTSRCTTSASPGLIEASLPEDEAVPLMKRALRRMADA